MRNNLEHRYANEATSAGGTEEVGAWESEQGNCRVARARYSAEQRNRVVELVRRVR